MTALPELIQGGMGVAVSDWRLARAVSSLGHLGVVSGTALDVVIARRLQLGDPGGELREAFDAFPDRAVARDVWARYVVPGGKARHEGFRNVPMFAARPSRQLEALAAVAGFVEVFLAKRGHGGEVGINFLQKVQLPTPAILYGALLARVDYVLVGAGIPRDIPPLIDALVRHQASETPLHVTGALAADRFTASFDPARLLSSDAMSAIRRPRFLPIVSSATLAASLVRAGARIDGFIVEDHTAGGHNAPPRGRQVAEDGEPVYGPRDAADLARMREIGLPFWLAGGTGRPGSLAEAKRQGAAGIQVGTLFALCEESGLDPAIRARMLEQIKARTARVRTDPRASPTGFPLKVAQVEGTLSESAVYDSRERRCDLGYLRELYRRADGTIGYRCPGEPVANYVKKGGAPDETDGRKCLCNGLLATVGLGQQRSHGAEPPIVTAGAHLIEARRLLRGRDAYSARDVVDYLVTPALD